MKNQPQKNHVARRSWLGALAGVAAGLFGAKLARPGDGAWVRPPTGTSAARTFGPRSAAAPNVKPAKGAVKRHG